jgi:putative transcriptional regulator
MDATSRLSIRLREIRRSRKLSQEALAKACGVPLDSLRNWEQGRREPSFSAVVQLAEKLGCTLDEMAHAPEDTHGVTRLPNLAVCRVYAAIRQCEKHLEKRSTVSREYLQERLELIWRELTTEHYPGAR